MDKMILIDLETQNFSVKSGIYEIACLVVVDYEIVDSLYLGKEIPDYIGERKYGNGFFDISNDLECINEFKRFLGKYPYPLVAHNCPFDKKFLVFYQWINDNYPTYCSMRAVKNTVETLDSYALENLVKHYNLADEIEHKAMTDIENLYKVLRLLRPTVWIPVGTSVNSSRVYNKVKARPLELIDLKIDNTSLLKNEVVCFTGQSNYPRNIMEEIAIKNGAIISSSITSKTTLLVVGINAGSKLIKAYQKGISIITAIEFLRLLDLLDKDITA